MSPFPEYIENDQIWAVADAFRESPLLADCKIPPIDVLYVVDVILRYDVVPIPSMLADLRMDAAIVPGHKIIYMDQDSLTQWERKDSWIEKRLRFTVAHELGHQELHAGYMADVRFANAEEFKSWILAHRQNRRLEVQADEFAGRFLVPPDILRQEYDLYMRRLQFADPSIVTVQGMREYVAGKIAPRFGVNRQVIETRFDHEGIWPAA